MNSYNIDIQYLDKVAEEEGFKRDKLEKAFRLSEILRFFHKSSLLNKYLALRGGMAINFTILRSPRLTEDLDWIFTLDCGPEEIAAAREEINDEIRSYMEKEGYKPSLVILTPKRFVWLYYTLGLYKLQRFDSLKWIHGRPLIPGPDNPFFFDSWRFEYTNAGGKRDCLKIEIYYGNMCSVLPIAERSNLAGFLGNFTVRTLSTAETFASKIWALIIHSTARDLYDVYNLLKSKKLEGEIDRLMLRKTLVFFLATDYPCNAEDVTLSFGRFERIEKLSVRQARTQLFPLLRKSDGFDLEKAKEEVISFLKGFLVFSEEEHEFIKRFRNREYRPDILFPEGNIAEGLWNYPQALLICRWHLRHQVII